MRKIKEILLKFWHRLLNNWKLKLVALLLAVIFWNSVIAGTDPLVSRTTDPIPVTVIGTDQLHSNDLVITNEPEEYQQSVRVTVKMNRSKSETFDQEDVQVTLDLSKITSTGEQIVKVTAYSNKGTIERIVPESFTINVDNLETKIIPIEYTLEGELPEGYWAGEMTYEPNTLQIAGPSTMIDQVSAATVSIDLNDRTSSISLPIGLSLVDEDKEFIDTDTISMSVDSAMFEMSIYPLKQIKIIAENCISGMDKLPDGYQVEDIEIYPETVEITGTAERLEGLTSLPSEVIDIAGKTEDVYATIQLLIPEGITLHSSSTSKVSLIIRISEIIQKTTFEDLPVELRNMPAGLSAEDFDEVRTVELLVPSNTVSTLTASHVKPYIDLSELSAGEHELVIQCEIPEEFRATDIVVENDTAKVVLVE